MKAPMRPTATDKPFPVERKWIGNISENVGYAEILLPFAIASMATQVRSGN
jgi:hypothetical protein